MTLNRSCGLAFLAILVALQGCSTINWSKTGEAWRRNHCHDMQKRPCEEAPKPDIRR